MAGTRSPPLWVALNDLAEVLEELDDPAADEVMDRAHDLDQLLHEPLITYPRP